MPAKVADVPGYGWARELMMGDVMHGPALVRDGRLILAGVDKVAFRDCERRRPINQHCLEAALENSAHRSYMDGA